LNSIVLIVVLFALHSEGTYLCTYHNTLDSTVYGSVMDNSGQTFPSAETCLNYCCNTQGCVAVTWVSSSGGCYLKTAAAMSSNVVTPEVGTQLLTISTQNKINPCKRGVAYGGWLTKSDYSSLMSSLTWYYEWTPTPDSVSATVNGGNIEFVPMIWGQEQISALPTVPLRSGYLMAFNEPNFGIQSNITPQLAASLWPTIQAYADTHNLKLVSPSMNFCGSPCNVADPIEWLNQFFAACVNCRVDYIGMHSYACEVQYLRDHVNLYKVFNRQIWVTEFACGDDGSQSVAVQEAYMTDALAYLDSDPDVFRYSWFSGRTTVVDNVNLLAGTAQLTSLGNLYVSGYSCPGGVSSSKSDSVADSDYPTISPSAAIIASAFVIFVLVIPIGAVGGYVCYKKRHSIAEVV